MVAAPDQPTSTFTYRTELGPRLEPQVEAPSTVISYLIPSDVLHSYISGPKCSVGVHALLLWTKLQHHSWVSFSLTQAKMNLHCTSKCIASFVVLKYNSQAGCLMFLAHLKNFHKMQITFSTKRYIRRVLLQQLFKS